MKLSRGSGKATLPGLLAVYRLKDRDHLCFSDETPPPGGVPPGAPEGAPSPESCPPVGVVVVSTPTARVTV